MDSVRKLSKKATGRPGKGARDTFVVKVTADEGMAIRQYCDEAGINFQDLLNPWIVRGLSELIAEDHTRTQEELPIGKAS